MKNELGDDRKERERNWQVEIIGKSKTKHPPPPHWDRRAI